MPSDLMFKTANGLHRVVQKVSLGKLGWHVQGMPVVELTTIGAKSGQPRTVMLTSPVQVDGRYLVVASRGGDPKNPAWYHNLLANPEVEAAIDGKPKRKMKATVVGADERAELWSKVTAQYKGYAGYQTKTTREIPLVFLEPV
jgi:deazaflavin-dependent oxidoreductase (nitroreductase family)